MQRKNDTVNKSIVFSLIFVVPAVVLNRYGLAVSLLFFVILAVSIFFPYFKQLMKKNKWLHSYVFFIYGLYYLSILLNYLGYTDSGWATFLMIIICISQVFVKNK